LQIFYSKPLNVLNTDNESNLIDIPDTVDEEALDDSWINNNYDRSIKTNLHDTYLYLHGFIDASLKKRTC